MAEIDFNSARVPDRMRVYAIGDVHGCLELLTSMHEAIDAEIARDGPDDWRVVHLGDYCDRGPDTKGVIDLLAARLAADARNICLRGNHDEGMLHFLDGRESASFTHHGGDTTCASYGVEADLSSPAGLEASRAELSRAMPAAHRSFLERLPTSVTIGDLFLCHAGVRPGVRLDEQSPHDLIWIRGEFHRHVALYDKLVVHGHTPVETVEIWPNRVNLDTRAFASGVLSGMAFEGVGKRVLEVSSWKR